MRHGIGFVVMVSGLCFISRSAYAEFWGFDGWGGKPVANVSGNWLPSSGSGDVDGEVGHLLSVKGPKGDCHPPGHQWTEKISWTGSVSIVSGVLPPGLTMNMTTGDISGIPTERGHWIVTVSDSNISCGGQDYNDYSEQLRFHITGTGKVIE